MSDLQFHSVEQQDGTHFYVKGALTRETLAPLVKNAATEIEKSLPFSSSIIWHFGELNVLDSAGFAFLCDVLKKGETVNSQKIADYPESFLTLADLFGLKHWIEPLTI